MTALQWRLKEELDLKAVQILAESVLTQARKDIERPQSPWAKQSAIAFFETGRHELFCDILDKDPDLEKKNFFNLLKQVQPSKQRYKKGGAGGKVLMVLKANEGQLLSSQLKKIIRSEKALENTLRKMVADGLIERIGASTKSSYRITEKGRNHEAL